MPNAGADCCRQDCHQLNRRKRLGVGCECDVTLAGQLAARVSWRVLVVLIGVLRRHSVVRVFGRITRMRVNGSGQNTAVVSRLILNANAARRDIWEPGNSQQSGNRPATTDPSERRAHTFATAPIHGDRFVVTAISILIRKNTATAEARNITRVVPRRWSFAVMAPGTCRVDHDFALARREMRDSLRYGGAFAGRHPRLAIAVDRGARPRRCQRPCFRPAAWIRITARSRHHCGAQTARTPGGRSSHRAAWSTSSSR